MARRKIPQNMILNMGNEPILFHSPVPPRRLSNGHFVFGYFRAHFNTRLSYTDQLVVSQRQDGPTNIDPRGNESYRWGKRFIVINDSGDVFVRDRIEKREL